MFHSKSIFKKYLISYCIAISIPLFLGIVLYFSLYITVRNTVEKQYENSLYQAQHTIDQHFEEIDNITRQILLHPQIERHFSQQSDSFAVYEGHSILSVYSFSNPFVKNIILYNQHNDVVSDFNTTFILSDFYGDAISFGDYSYEQFKDTVLKNNNYNQLYTCRKNKYFDEISNDILYISNYPLGTPKNANGNVIVVIPAEKIFQKFSFISEIGGHFYILDKNNNLIINSESAPELIFSGNKISLSANKEYILHKVVSTNGITYITALPNDAVISEMSSVTYCMIIVLSLTAILLLWIIWFLAKRNSTPIKEILQSFSANTEEQEVISPDGINELDLISKNISQLMEANKLNRTELEQNIPFLVSSFAQNLLYGNILSNRDITNQAEKLGIKLGKEYIAIIISIPPVTTNLDTISAIKVLIKKSLNQSPILLNTDLSELDTGVIVISNESDGDSLSNTEKIINEIGEAIYNHLSIRIRVAIGSPCNEPNDIFHSYYTAKDNLIHGIQTIHQNVEWFVEKKINSQSYFYPMDIENRIVTAVLNKHLDLAIDCVSLLRKENIDNRLLNIDQTLQLFRSIKGTIYKCLNETALLPNQKQELENKLPELDSVYDLESGFSRFTELLKQIDNFNRNDNSVDVSSDVFQYMADNFTNPLLDRTMFANHFGITSEYASSFFKNNTGYSFSEYLEKIRIGEACKLLSEKNLTINEISEIVGYNSALSFRRAFKRLLGISPSEYAKKL